MNPFLENIQTVLQRIPTRQKIALAAVLVGGIGILVVLAQWATQPDLTLLFGDLTPENANRIVEVLKEEQTDYELRGNGTAIYVPRERKDELRLRLLSEGTIDNDVEGYSILDNAPLGTTKSQQVLMYKRALEGELAKTITSLRQVEMTKVFLVMPERSAFRQNQSQPSASVVLELSGTASLSPPQVEGITALVAGAVEGMMPTGVTVLDTRGNMLSNPDAGSPALMLTTSQLRLQHATEEHLTDKGQSMLDQFLGPGNAIVRVTAALNFDTATTTSVTVDPESATVVSEERLDDQRGAGDTSNSMVRNYELSETTQTTTKGIGGIDFLTISVILNQKPLPRDPEAEEGAPVTFTSYEEDELNNIESLVQNAVGFSPARGDQIAVHQRVFDDTIDNEIVGDMMRQERNRMIEQYVRYALMVLALLVAVWLMRSASQKAASLSPEVRAAEAQAEARKVAEQEELDRVEMLALEARKVAEAELEYEIDDVFDSKYSADAKARIKAKQKLFEEIRASVDEQPDAAADLFRSWLAGDDKLAIARKAAAAAAA